MAVSAIALVGALGGMQAASAAAVYNDSRNLFNGAYIVQPGNPPLGYQDQPYCATGGRDGSWTCVITVGSGGEGGAGEHMSESASCACFALLFGVLFAAFEAVCGSSCFVYSGVVVCHVVWP